MKLEKPGPTTYRKSTRGLETVLVSIVKPAAKWSVRLPVQAFLFSDIMGLLTLFLIDISLG